MLLARKDLGRRGIYTTLSEWTTDGNRNSDPGKVRAFGPRVDRCLMTQAPG